MTKKGWDNVSMKNRLKELRAKHDISQLQLAEIVNVRRETIVHLEKNKYNPSLKLASQIAHFFGLPVEEVIWFEFDKS